MTLTVLVTDKVSDPGLAPLTNDLRFSVVRADDSTSSDFWSALPHCDGLIVRSATTVDEEMISRAVEMKAIGRAGVGVDNIDVDSATARGIAVLNAPGGNTIAAAELTVALMLASARNVSAADRSVRSGGWDRSTFRGVELSGKTLGLVGAGRIGGEVAFRCQAFGMKVIVYDPYLSPQRGRELGVELVGLDRVLEISDVISIHVPLTEETRGLLGAQAFEQIKPSAIVVNASRGGVIDEQALARALADGKIAGAALDVFEVEPLPEDSPLRSAPNLLVTPHLGAATVEAQVAVAAEVAEGIRKVLGEGDLASAINASALGH